MKSSRALVVMAALMLAACGGGEEGADGAAADADVPPTPAGTVDTAGVGVGTEPPTAGGQVVDTAAMPGAVDTAQGTPTAP